jgi:hypothetical protein
MQHDEVCRAISESHGFLRLQPAFVARDWLPPGRRLGLDDIDVGERGSICERWLASTTHADNRVGPADEGISHIRTEAGELLNLKDAVAAAPAEILGTDYAASHSGLGRLAKIFDFAARIPMHIHPPLEQAQRAGRNSKDEAYYFPAGVDLGPHPETFFGLHPWIARDRRWDLLLEHLEEWHDDLILQYSFAYRQLPEEGYFIGSGILHAPGTALTIELQEDSDAQAIFQALNAGTVVSKELLYKDVTDADRTELAESALRDWIDWDANGDPDFHANHHILPRPIWADDDADEAWILYGTRKFSGKRLRVHPGAKAVSRENGVYSILVWSGTGTIDGHRVRAGDPLQDELLVVDSAARAPHTIVNDGEEELLIVKFFGPDLNPEAPVFTAAG